jgi:hypothetical protein
VAVLGKVAALLVVGTLVEEAGHERVRRSRVDAVGEVGALAGVVEPEAVDGDDDVGVLPQDRAAESPEQLPPRPAPGLFVVMSP